MLTLQQSKFGLLPTLYTGQCGPAVLRIILYLLKTVSDDLEATGLFSIQTGWIAELLNPAVESHNPFDM